MKKIITTLAAASILSAATASAEPELFVKFEGGAQKFVDSKFKDEDIKVKIQYPVVPFFGAGVGVKATDSLRADITATYYANRKVKIKAIDLQTNEVVRQKEKLKSMWSFMVNGTYDIVDFEVAKLFLGAGVGMSLVKTTDVNEVNGQITENKTKNHGKFAYAATAGVTVPVADKINLDLAYSWRDLGKINKVKFRGHNIVAGVRVGL